MLQRDKQLESELQPHMSTLMNSMSHKVQANLVAANLLYVIDIDNISLKAESTMKERNSKMYRMLLTRVKTACDSVKTEAMCKGLCESAQYCPFLKNEKPASANQKEIL